MKGILPALTGIMLCATTTHSNASDSAPLQYELGKKMPAAVTDTPEIVDMSHADPKTWHRLPPAAQVHDQALSQKMKLPVQVQQASTLISMKKASKLRYRTYLTT